MGAKTGISWTGSTWSCLRGCSRTIAKGAKTSGCGDPTGGGCYAERTGYRFAGVGLAYEGLVRMTPNGPRWTGKVLLVDEHLLDPVRWTDARMIFTTSVSDPFHESLPFELIALLYGVMAITPHHIHQCLTKRAAIRRRWYAWVAAESAACNGGVGMTPAAYCFTLLQRYVNHDQRGSFSDHDRKRLSSAKVVEAALSASWPLSNVWEGTSVEHQLAAVERIPELLETPCAVRFLSIEPLIDEVDLGLPNTWLVGATARKILRDNHARGPVPAILRPPPSLDWIIVGCESGPGARPMNVEWVRKLRDQCAAAGVAFFLKQAEESTDCGEDRNLDIGDDDSIAFDDGSKMKARRPGGHHIIELPYLDGVQHRAFPETAT